MAGRGSSDEETKPEEHRSARRVNLMLAATVDAFGATTQARIRNISQTGALLEGSSLPDTGARVTVRRLHLAETGVVAWGGGGRCGIRFDGPIVVADWISGTALPPRTRGKSIRANPPPTGKQEGPPSADIPAQALQSHLSIELASLSVLLERIRAALASGSALADHPGELDELSFAARRARELAVEAGASDSSTAFAALPPARPRF